MDKDDFETLTTRESLMEGAKEALANIKIYSSHANALIASLPIFAALSLLNRDNIPNWLVGMSISAFGGGFILSFWYLSRRAKETNDGRIAVFKTLGGDIKYSAMEEILKNIAVREKRSTRYLLPIAIALLAIGFAALCAGAFM